MRSNGDSNRLIIDTNPTEEEMEVVKKGLDNYNRQQPNGDLDIPTPDISLVMKDKEDNIVGGVITSMLVGVMHLEVLWVDKRFRGQGLGRALVLEVEKLGRAKGYTAAQTWTFSFNAPEFYQNIGYKLLGIFDGYPNGVTEYVLMKRLKSNQQTPTEPKRASATEFTISEDASVESMKILHNGLYEYFLEHAGELQKKYPEIQINLVIKNNEGKVIGGLLGSTVLNVLYINQIWIKEQYRTQGYGKKLLGTAERIAREKGVLSGLAMVYSFQTPEFFQKVGYETFGVSDGYPDPTREYFFKKRY